MQNFIDIMLILDRIERVFGWEEPVHSRPMLILDRIERWKVEVIRCGLAEG